MTCPLYHSDTLGHNNSMLATYYYVITRVIHWSGPQWAEEP